MKKPVNKTPIKVNHNVFRSLSAPPILELRPGRQRRRFPFRAEREVRGHPRPADRRRRSRGLASHRRGNPAAGPRRAGARLSHPGRRPHRCGVPRPRRPGRGRLHPTWGGCRLLGRRARRRSRRVDHRHRRHTVGRDELVGRGARGARSGGHPGGHPHGGGAADPKDTPLRLVAWETTRNCNLACKHCRASADLGPFDGELDTAASFRLLDQIAADGSSGLAASSARAAARSGVRRSRARAGNMAPAWPTTCSTRDRPAATTSASS